MIIIQQQAMDQMVAHCSQSVPLEACGVLLGFSAEDGDAGTPIIRHTAAVTNRADNPEKAFRFDEREWLALLYDMERNGMKLLGIYHSHPTSPPFPSAEDLGSAWLGLSSYWIISLASGKPAISAYRLTAAEDRSSSDFIAIPYSIV